MKRQPIKIEYKGKKGTGGFTRNMGYQNLDKEFVLFQKKGTYLKPSYKKIKKVKFNGGDLNG